MTTIEDRVRDYTLLSVQRPENAFTSAFYQEHILVVLNYADQLCSALGGDREVVRIAAYLHDLAAVLDVKTLPVHHEAGAENAGAWLARQRMAEEKIRKVQHCIRQHSAPLPLEGNLVEAVCLSNADAISQIVNPAYWLYYIYQVRSISFEEGRTWYRNKINANWNGLIEPAKRMAEARYATVKNCLEG